MSETSSEPSSETSEAPPAEPVPRQPHRRVRRRSLLIVSIVAAVAFVSVTATLLLASDGSPLGSPFADRAPAAGLRAGDCVALLPETVDHEFTTVAAIPCAAPDAKYRMVAVLTSHTRQQAQEACLHEVRRIGKPLQLLSAAPPDKRGDAICVETLS
ncbi:hypothetical protein [Virgisporangium aurantiacum]|uniref:Uncharacterized protein n=1 Tax=Virgisporangium aurantiacum TaxID=175570 RepID=A0A8J3ZIB7_9ACTN|nr:hypothetical protein [Virgisporangium aurantiacum]GIJ64409.1 hypothetical protein Vau01_119250 [Virgisporangium aurantiacum]